MMNLRHFALSAACLSLVAGLASAEPSFKKKPEGEKEEKAFFTDVGEAIVKAARTKPVKLELESLKIEARKDKPTRKTVTIKMTWAGSTTGTRFASTIKLDCDASDKEKWEVLTIEYTDNNRVPRVGSEGRIKELVKKFNR